MPWFTFVNPWLLAGSVLVGAPILIHLLTRRRHQRVRWAAMDLLREADQQTRRRIRLENLLLLLLRCLAVLLLVLLVARPWWQLMGMSGVGSVLLGGGAVEHVVVLDDSPSMGVRQETGTSFDVAVNKLRDMLQGMAAGEDSSGQAAIDSGLNKGDLFTLMVTSQPGQPIIDRQHVTRARVLEWVQQLSEMTPSQSPASYQNLFDQFRERWSTQKDSPDTLPRRLYLLSDFREPDWIVGTTANPGPLIHSLRELGKMVQAIIVGVQGEDHPANLAITELDFNNSNQVVGVDTRIMVTVANFGAQAVRDLPVNLRVNQAPPQRAMIDQLEPGQKVTLPFTVVFSEAQPYRLMAELGADALPIDNQRHLSAWVQPGVGVLLVSGGGHGHGQGQRSETFYLEQALQPKGTVISGNLVEVVSQSRLETLSFDKYQVIFLCNLPGLSEIQTNKLETWAKSGGTLVVFLGDQIDVQAYNRWTHQAGQGLLPGTLTAVQGEFQADQFARLSVMQPNHPLLGIFTGSGNPFLNRVKIQRYWRMNLPESSSPGSDSVSLDVAIGDQTARGKKQVDEPVTLLALDTPDQQPIVVEQPLGKGQALWFMTWTDEGWSNWAGDPSFVVLMLELVRELAAPAAGGMNLRVGETLRYELDPGIYGLTVQLTSPGGSSLRLPAQAGETDNRLHITHEPMNQTGFYELGLRNLEGQPVTIPFAVNLPGEEGQLQRADLDQLQQQVGEPWMTLQSLADSGLPGQADQKIDLWRPILLLLVLVLMGEQTLAWSMGRRR